ncbi:hypothetical protein CPC08DRAFT_726592 [Agrocybe pediades]|nr:hypothetical protein CPC08DRAFT_726592 [Agrocybe pediades]
MSSTTLNSIEVFIFSGSRFQEWSVKMNHIFLMNKVQSIIDGTFGMPIEPPAAQNPEPTMPADADTRSWKVYDVQLKKWQKKYEDYHRDAKEWSDRNSMAKGIIMSAVIPSIWESIAEKMARAGWADLKARFDKPQFNELLDLYRRLHGFKFDLSDPTPQLANFMAIFGKIEKIKAGLLHKSMVGLLLLSRLPLNTAVNQPESIYQPVVNYFNDDSKFSASALQDLDDIQNRVRTAWMNRFGTLNKQQRPKKGTTIRNSAVASSSKQPAAGPSVQSAEHNSAIKPKTNHLQYIPLQAPFKGTPQGSSAPQQNEKPKRKHTRKGKGKAHANEIETGIPNEVFMASTAQPSLPAPTRSTVMEINGRGSISSRQFSHTGAWKHLDNRMAPYLAPQAARTLANRLGARPTGPLLGRLEQVAHL